MFRLTAASFIAAISFADPALAAALDGASLPWPWALPFAGILLTIAAGPLLFAKLWHHHYGKFAFAWSAATLLPLALLHGTGAALAAFVHTALAEYMSFIVLLFALYVVAGGILVTGNLRGTPATNTTLLAFGTLIASVVGTTGAAISMGAVFMGALTYIGNAPNFMVYAIATERGVAMPSFFAFILWSLVVLMPVFAVLAWLRFST